MLSISGINKNTLIKYIHNKAKVNNLSNIHFVLEELQSVNGLIELWHSLVLDCLKTRYHKNIIDFIHLHCEDIPILNPTFTKNTITKLLNLIATSTELPNILSSIPNEVIIQFKLNKRQETKMWKNLHLNESSEYTKKLNHIAQTFHNIEDVHIRLHCYIIAYCKHNGH